MPTHSWLPATALTLEKARRIFAGPLDAWSNVWFASSAAVVSDWRTDGPPSGGGPRVDDISARVVLPPRLRRNLFEQACRVNLADVLLTDADRQLIDDLTDEMARDLLTRMNLTAGAGGEERHGLLTISLDGREVLHLHIPLEAIIERIKADIPRTDSGGSPMRPRTRAIAQTSIDIEAVVGRGAVAIRDLSVLAVGDVLLLDEKIEAGIALVASRTGHIIARGRLGRDNEHPTVEL